MVRLLTAVHQTHCKFNSLFWIKKLFGLKCYFFNVFLFYETLFHIWLWALLACLIYIIIYIIITIILYRWRVRPLWALCGRIVGRVACCMPLAFASPYIAFVSAVPCAVWTLALLALCASCAVGRCHVHRQRWCTLCRVPWWRCVAGVRLFFSVYTMKQYAKIYIHFKVWFLFVFVVWNIRNFFLYILNNFKLCYVCGHNRLFYRQWCNYTF
jgi:hypothetical protein